MLHVPALESRDQRIYTRQCGPTALKRLKAHNSRSADRNITVKFRYLKTTHPHGRFEAEMHDGLEFSRQIQCLAVKLKHPRFDRKRSSAALLIDA